MRKDSLGLLTLKRVNNDHSRWFSVAFKKIVYLSLQVVYKDGHFLSKRYGSQLKFNFKVGRYKK